MRIETLRSKVVALVAAALVPTLALTLLTLRRDRALMLEEKGRELQLTAGLLAEHYERVFLGTKDVLASLAPRLPLRDPDACRRLLRGALGTQPHLLNLAAARRDGSLACSAVLAPPGAKAADRTYFQEALATRALSVGLFQLSRVTGQPDIVVALPLAQDGAVEAVLIAAIDVRALSEQFSDLPLPAGTVIALLDKTGRVVAREPMSSIFVGRSARGTGIGEYVLRQPPVHGRPAPAVEESGLDGVARLYAYAPVHGLPSGALTALVGIPREEALAVISASQRRGVLSVLAVAALVLAATWWLGEHELLRHTDRLLAMSRRIAAGGLDAGGPVEGDGEVAQIAGTLVELVDRHRQILESAAEGICGVDAAGNVQVINPAAARALGCSVDEAAGREFGLLVHGPEAEAAEHRAGCPLRRALDRREAYRSLDETFVRKDGSRFPVELSVAPVPGNRMVVVFRDVSEPRRLLEQFVRAQKLESVGRLAGGVAHDFNNVLTAIGGFAQLLGDGLEPGDARRADVQEIQRAVERASALTRQLLAFSRKQLVQPKVLEVNALVEGVLKMLRRLVPEDVRLETRLAARAGQVYADPGQLEQVLMNLVVNARDAMPRGGAITLETADAEVGPDLAAQQPELRPGPYALVAVSDTGTGIPSEVLPHIFEPFFTTKETGRGTGLGLATVHGVVRQAGGAVLVRTEVGRGTTFEVYLPRTGRAAPEAIATAAGPARTRGTERILVVEDDDSVRRLARRALSREGYDIVEAGSGEEALRLFRADRGRVRLVLSDVVMPGMRGTELAAALRALEPGLRVVLMSGYADLGDDPQGLGPGISLLPKPVTPEALARRVRETLDLPQAR